MNVLEELEVIQLISRNEDKLLTTMTDTRKELFTGYEDCVREYHTIAEKLLFQNSFKLGTRIMLEATGVVWFFLTNQLQTILAKQ